MDDAIAHASSRLRPTKRTLSLLESVNDTIISKIISVARDDAEPQSRFFRRRALKITELRDLTKTCAQHSSLTCLVSWTGHIFRHQACPLYKLWAIQKHEWLEERRGCNYSRPATRAESGFAFRWQEGWLGRVEREDGLGCIFRKAERGKILSHVIFVARVNLGRRDRTRSCD